MSALKLHIISFDVPYPADYGGAIDVFYKIKALHEAGCEIYLHCYEYGRGKQPALQQYCKEIWYYPRKTGIRGISARYPYIVNSRRSSELLQRLLSIDAPVLFEGVHTSFYAQHPALKDRFKLFRTHNVEHQYYRQLYQREKSPFAKMFFQVEAALLKKYESRLHAVDLFLELSLSDKEYFNRQYPSAQHEFIAPFHPFTAEDIPTGQGKYCLYQGNLSHPENIEAALFLLERVIPEVKYPFVIAGRKPPAEVIERCRALSNCTLYTDPDEATMNTLIKDAHIHVLPTFQRSGMKLKLLYALYSGRHVMANDNILLGTGLEPVCCNAESPQDFIDGIAGLINQEFSQMDRQDRANLLDVHYNNRKNAERIMSCLQRRSR